MRTKFRYSLTGSILAQIRTHWITFLLLAAFFFLLEHNFYSSLQFGKSADEIIKEVSKGNLRHQIALTSIGFFGLLNLFGKGKKVMNFNSLLPWVCLFFIFWSFLTIFWTIDAQLTIKRLIAFLLIWIGCLGVNKRLSLSDLTTFIFVSTTFYLVLGITVELLLGTFHPFLSDYRFCGTLGDNIQGINCALMIISAVSLYDMTDRLKPLLFFAIFIGFIFLILTKSRTSFYGTIITVFVYFTIVSKSRMAIGIYITIMIFLLSLLIFGDPLIYFIKKAVLLDRDIDMITLKGRYKLWADCLSYLAQAPIIGYGYNSFWTPRHIASISETQNWGIVYAHSAYLDLALGTGIVGMIIYVLIYLMTLKQLYYHYKTALDQTYAFWFSLIVFCLVNGITESAIVNPTMLTFLSIFVFINIALYS